MKKQKMMTTGFLTAALMLSFAGTCFADTAPAAETQAAGQEEAGAQAATERKTLPASFGMPYIQRRKGFFLIFAVETVIFPKIILFFQYSSVLL